MFTDIELALEVLNKYYILSDVKDGIAIAYNFETDKIYLFGEFPLEFINSLEREKYGIVFSDGGYVVNALEGILYFYHEYRNYITNLPKIDILSFMVEDLRKMIISKYRLDISNDSWMLEDEKNHLRYLETKRNTSSKMRQLLDEFDSIVNPNSENVNMDVINRVKGYITDDGRKCIAVETKDEISTRRYLRRNEGFVYKFIIKNNNEDINICHYFNEDGEGISALINGVKVRYSLTTNVLQINDKAAVLDDYLVCEILMNAIKYYNVDLYNKIKLFK